MCGDVQGALSLRSQAQLGDLTDPVTRVTAPLCDAQRHKKTPRDTKKCKKQKAGSSSSTV
jgi:hypothetical protein